MPRENAFDESAAAYGHSVGCFRDYLRYYPSSLLDGLEAHPSSTEHKDIYGLIHQDGLPQLTIPKFRIEHDETVPDSTRRYPIADLATEEGSSASSPQLFRTLELRNLHLPLELIQLETDPQADLKTYREQIHRQQSCDLTSHWLPLCSVRTDRDEGVTFPPRYERFRSLLLKELNNEKLQDLVSTRSFEIASCNESSATPLAFGDHVALSVSTTEVS